jgi:hypothetical protein
LQKIGYFRILIFGLSLSISGTLAYNVFLRLFSGKKTNIDEKSLGPVFKEIAL